MAAVLFANTVRCRLNWSFNNALWAQNVLHYKAVATNPAVTQATADDMDATIKAALTASGLRSSLSDQWKLENVTVQAAYSNTLPEYTGSGAAVAGTSTANPLPAQNALVVTLRTANVGRSYRGRVYLGGFTEAATGVTGQALVATMTDCEDFINGISSMAIDPSSAVVTLAVGSRVLQTANIVTSVVVRDSVFDIQRRRRDGIAAG